MINQASLLQNYDDKKANYFLLDVRTPAEYEEGHLPGSVNIPIDELEARFTELPKDRHIITICLHGVRSGICEKFLKQKGFLADSLDGGLSIWKGQVQKN